MAETYKNRREHRGQPAPHLGQDHYEKSSIEASVGSDHGPTFKMAASADYHEQPQQPADVTYRS